MKHFIREIVLGAFLALVIVCGCGLFYYSAEPILAAAEPVVQVEEQQYITVKAVGDVMLSRKVGRLMNEKGVDYPVKKVADYLADADLTFGNLESPISTKGSKLPGKGIWFRAEPSTVDALQMAGFDLVCLANNHMMDYDEPALLETGEILDKAEILHIGSGANAKEASKIEITEVKGIKIAWIAYSEMADLFFSHEYPRRLRAEADKPGINSYNLDKICADIKSVREDVDIIIVTLHWGLEYQDYPQSYQTVHAHKMIDSGADLIIGHHPHCIQGMEEYNNGLIFYSLGNFIFDQDWSEQTKQGVTLKLTLNGFSWQEVEILPVYITEGQAQLATGETAKTILNNFKNFSKPFGADFEDLGNSIKFLPAE
ncbi:MAG: CapA family protein [Clostridia bacterium]|nr:CapA family protein [Clostridia bacterium]